MTRWNLGMVIMTVVSTLAVGTAWGAEPKDKTVTKSAEKTTEASVGKVKTGKVLFLGNSITLHGPMAEIGWTNNWGMAASAQEKDYVQVASARTSPITLDQSTAMHTPGLPLILATRECRLLPTHCWPR